MRPSGESDGRLSVPSLASVRLVGAPLPSLGAAKISRLVDSRFDPAGFAQREIDGPAVRREVDLLAAAERLGRGVTDQRAGQRGAGAGHLAALDRKTEKARSDARLGPGIPVADEQLVVGAAAAGLRLPSARSAQAKSVQRRSRSAQMTSRRPIGASLNPPMSPLRLLTCTGAPAGAMRNSWSCPAGIHQEPDRAVAANTASWPFWAPAHRLRRRALGLEVQQIERIVALVGGKIRVGDGENRPTAIGRDFRRAEAMHHLHVGGGHRPGDGGGSEERGGGNGREQGALNHGREA